MTPTKTLWPPLTSSQNFSTWPGGAINLRKAFGYLWYIEEKSSWGSKNGNSGFPLPSNLCLTGTLKCRIGGKRVLGNFRKMSLDMFPRFWPCAPIFASASRVAFFAFLSSSILLSLVIVCTCWGFIKPQANSVAILEKCNGASLICTEICICVSVYVDSRYICICVYDNATLSIQTLYRFHQRQPHNYHIRCQLAVWLASFYLGIHPSSLLTTAACMWHQQLLLFGRHGWNEHVWAVRRYAPWTTRKS